MPINEYDDLISGKPVAAGNEYDDMLGEQTQSQRQGLQASMVVAAGQDPDRKAQILQLAQKAKLPPAIVERNFDSVYKKTEIASNDYDSLIEETPKLASWLQNPDNAVLAKDDLPNLQKVEKSVTDYDNATKAFFALNVGLSKLYSGISKIPAFAFDLYHLQDNIDRRLEGKPEIKAPDWLMNNPVAKYFDQAAANIAQEVPELDGSIIKSIQKGDYRDAGKNLAFQLVANAPQQAAIIAGTLATGGAVPTLIAAGTVAGAQANAEAREQGVAPSSGTSSAIIKGTVEAAFERIGTMGILKHWEGAIAKEFGKQTSKEVMKDFAKTMAFSFAGEANEEFMTSVASDFSDYATGTNPNALEGMWVRAGDAGFIGGFSGATMTAPSALASGATRAQQVRKANLTRDFYLSLGNTVEGTKLRERMPEAKRQYIEEMVKDTPVENVYIPVEAMEVYFQSKNIPPAKAAQDIGIAKEFDQAKETGEDIKIPLAQFVDKLAGSEHYEGLSRDIKLSPEELSINQLQEEEARTRESVTETDQTAVQDVEANERSIKMVQEDVKAQLKAAGYTEQEATRQAQIYGAAFGTLSSKANQTAEALYEKYQLKIQKQTVLQSGEIVLNQKTRNGLVLPVKVKDGSMSIQPLDNVATSAKIIQAQTGKAMQIDGFTMESQYAGVAGDMINSLEKAAASQGANAIFTSTQRLGIDPSVETFEDTLKVFEAEGFKVTRGEDGHAVMVKTIDRTTLFQGDEDMPRGQIRFGKENRQFNIDLLEGKDPSTFIHETGHFFLEVMGDLAQSADTAQTLKDDYAVLLSWLGVESRDQIKVEHHEQFARGFEAYLMEGKAPTSALRKAFSAFKVWLTSVYKQIQNLNVNLTPEVRSVMDRILATDEQINRAEMVMQYDPLFADPTAMGMSDTQAARYIQAREEARLASEDYVRQKLMKDFQRSEAKFYKEKRAEINAEVVKELSESRVYKALAALQAKPLPGAPQDFKISKASLEAVFDKDFIQTLPRGVTSKNGLHIEVVADMLGFGSGTQMAQAISNLPTLEQAAELETNKRMDELYPDSLSDGSINEEAVRAVHNDKRAQMLRMELEHLAAYNMPALKDAIRRVARRVPSEEVIRAQATQIIASKNVNDIRPVIYQRAEIKAAKEAGIQLAKGDIDAAFEAKRKELLNHELYRAAVEAKERIEKDVKNFKRLFKKDEDLAKTRDIDIVNAARAVLAQFGITKAEKTAQEYLAPMKAYDPDTYETISALVASATENAGNYKTVKYDDYVAMSDAVQSMWELSKSTREIEIDGVKMDRELVKTEMSQRLQELTAPGARVGYDKAADTWDKAKMNLMGIRSAMRRVESWADAIDGEKRSFTKYMIQPIVEATARYRLAKKGVLEQYLEVAKKLDQKSLVRNKAIVAQEIGYQFKDKTELLGALLHTGNDSNLAKLLLGRGWGFKMEDGSIDRTKWDRFINRMIQDGTLTKSDYEFAQGVWDLNESLKPEAQKAHKKMYGFYFNEITANEVKTPFGNFRGGYVPAVADQFLAQDAAIRSEKEALEKNNNSFMFPTAGRGFTKSRVDAYVAPLSLDLGMVPAHIDKVLRFVHIEPQVKAVGRIVMDKGFRKTLDAFDPTVGGDMLVPWLQRTAQQKVNMPSGTGWGWKAADTFFRELRSRTGLQVMTANLTNAFQQFSGLSIAAVKVKPRFLRNALWSYVKAPKLTSDSIIEKSDYMKSKLTASAMEVQGVIDDLLVNPTKYEKAVDFARKHGYFLQSGTQNIVDSMVWTGAYDQAIEEGMTEKEAVRHADSQVRLTQGTLAPEDVSRFETGTPFMRMFTQFYSYFNMQANLLGTEFIKTQRDLGLRKGAGRMMYIYAMGFMIPAVISELIVQTMAGKGFDADDDDEYLDDAMNIFFGSQLRSGAALVPVVGQTAMVAVNSFNDKWYDDRISTSPSISMVESAVKAPKSVYDAIQGKGSEKKAMKDTLTLLGLLTGAPLAPLGRPLGYLMDVESGKAEPSGPVDLARGLVTGKSGEERK